MMPPVLRSHRKRMATDELQEERSIPPPPSARGPRVLVDSDRNQILEPAVANDAVAETPQRTSLGLSQDCQLVIQSSTTNNVVSTYVPPRRPAKRSDFSIAIICALSSEATAVDAVFDVYWDDKGPPYDKVAGDPNAYTTGAIGRHNVVLAHMPGIGKVGSALVASNCRHSFPNIKLALVVGVCGGVPFSSTHDVSTEIILGDVIISDGIIQYDLGRQYDDHFEIKAGLLDTLARPSLEVRSFLSQLKVPRQRKMLEEEMAKIMSVLSVLPAQSGLSTQYPGAAKDKLYKATYSHIREKELCETCGCDGELVTRERLGHETPHPMIHLGIMASGDNVVKSAPYRDKIVAESKLKLEANIIGFEMEGAGVWDTFPCVVIKAVCDYADSHKAKGWQPYAAATAAACMKAFLKKWTPSPSLQEDTLSVPYPRNNNFVGRSDILAKLHQLWCNSTSQTRVALCGLGGIGKTQIAIEFTYRIQRTYPNISVFWVHASNHERFREAYTAIAQKYRIPGHEDPKAEVLPLVKSWLESQECGQWIMAIDNADDLELFFNRNGGLGRYLPECAHGTILITTRNLQVASRLTKGMASSVIRIGKMDEVETAQLLSTRLAEIDTMPGDYAGLSARLEHLPLALVQAASFIQENSITISRYIQLLDESDWTRATRLLSIYLAKTLKRLGETRKLLVQ